MILQQSRHYLVGPYIGNNVYEVTFAPSVLALFPPHLIGKLCRCSDGVVEMRGPVEASLPHLLNKVEDLIGLALKYKHYNQTGVYSLNGR